MTNLLQRYDFLLLPCRDNASPDESHWQTALSYITRVGMPPIWGSGLRDWSSSARF